MEEDGNIFVFWLESQSFISASSFVVVSSSLVSTVVLVHNASKRLWRIIRSCRGESGSDVRFGM